MAKVKIQLADNIKRVVTVDPDATKGATLGTDLYLNGAVATPAAMRSWLGVSTSSIGNTAGRPLTKTDDTNVTLTLGGYPGGALVSAASLALGWTGQLAAPRGGTGFGSYAAGDLLYANGTTSLAKLGVGSAGDLLRVSGGAPTWQAPSTLFANPSATYGANMTGANGSATTALRSDAVMKIDPGIAPTWTGVHTFSAQQTIVNSLVQTGASGTAGANRAAFQYAGGAYWDSYGPDTATVALTAIRALSSDTSVVKNAWATTISGGSITSIGYGNSTDNPPHTFYGQINAPNNISATYSSLNTTDGAISITNEAPVFTLSETGQMTNEKYWSMFVDGKVFHLNACADSGVVADFLTASRGAGNTIASMTYGNATDNPPHTFYGQINAPNNISATYSSLNTTDGAISITNEAPVFTLSETGQMTNEKYWSMFVDGKVFHLNACADSGVVADFLTASRGAGNTIASMTYGNATDNPTHTFYGVVKLTTGYIVSGLPSGVVGYRAYVTDALAPTFGSTVVGSGAVTVPVFYNGSNWIVG